MQNKYYIKELSQEEEPLPISKSNACSLNLIHNSYLFPNHLQFLPHYHNIDLYDEINALTSRMEFLEPKPKSRQNGIMGPTMGILKSTPEEG